MTTNAAPPVTDAAEGIGRESRQREVIPVVLYHAVTTRPSEWIADFTVSPATIRRHLDLVEESGRVVLTAGELGMGLAGVLPLPPRPMVITFDDGYADLADVVAPLFAERRIPATAFLTTGFVDGVSPGGDRMLSWAGAADVAAAGFEIGAHSVTHPELDVVGPRRLHREVVDCRAELQDRLDLPIFGFAYPHGYHDRAVVRAVRAAGYRSACAVRNAFSHPHDDSFAIARLTVTAATPPETVEAWLAGIGAPVAPYRENVSTLLWRLYRRSRRLW